MNDADLIRLIDKLKATMIAVATGGPRIGEVNHGYQEDFRTLSDALQARDLDNPNPHDDLWSWYGRWSQDDLPSYQSRRVYIGRLFEHLIARVAAGRAIELEPTGWARVDRTVDHAQDRLAGARNEEHFQAVGLLCREALISLAQEVFDSERHPTDPTVAVSTTDFRRMIEAYIAVELRGSSADEARRHARSALDLVPVHKRQAIEVIGIIVCFADAKPGGCG